MQSVRPGFDLSLIHISPEDIDRLYENQVDAVLIGETLMRSRDKKAALRELDGGGR